MPISGITSMLFFAAKLYLLWADEPDLDANLEGIMPEA